ncbi:MAG: mechanosensitive ion channel family protein [Treponema sp.]|nr:mechanosensitive ion channel family protein [Treponema sp.]
MNEAMETAKEVTSEVAETTRSFLHIDDLKEYLTWANMMKLIVSVLTIFLFFLVYKIIQRIVNKTASKKLQPHSMILLNKFIRYLFFVLIVMYVLSLLGINLKAVWGAAGIAGIALGFAAQTSVSNLISGFFIMVERSMKIGDYIEVSGVSGIVDNIGLLSVSVHTLDNQLIRIPNSTIIGTNLINYSHFEKRRFVFDLPISYDSDMDVALTAANEVADTCVKEGIVLADPAPKAYYDGFGSAVNLKLAIWFDRTKLLDTKNAVYTTTVKVFKKYGIVIPFTRYDISILDNSSSKAETKKRAVKKQ